MNPYVLILIILFIITLMVILISLVSALNKMQKKLDKLSVSEDEKANRRVLNLIYKELGRFERNYTKLESQVEKLTNNDNTTDRVQEAKKQDKNLSVEQKLYQAIMDLRNIKTLLDNQGDSEILDNDFNKHFQLLAENLNELESSMTNGSQFQISKLQSLEANDTNITNAMINMHNNLKGIESEIKANNSTLKEYLETIVSELSPFQEGSITKLNKELKEMKNQIDMLNNENINDKIQEQGLILQESIDALSEYIKLTSNNTNKIIESKYKSLDGNKMQEDIKSVEKQMIKYLGFIYQEMHKQSTQDGEDHKQVVDKIESVIKTINEYDNENKRHINILYEEIDSKK